MESNGAVGDPYWKIVRFDQKEGQVVGGTKWSSYRNHAKATSGVVAVNRKNLVVVPRLGGGPKESWCGLRGVSYANRGNVGTKVEGKTCRPLPLSNGKVWQLEDGTCIYESQTSNLLEEEHKELSQAMEVVQGTNRWNHLGGIWVLPKRWRVVPILYWNLSMRDAAFQAWQNVNPFQICIRIWFTKEWGTKWRQKDGGRFGGCLGTMA